MPTPTDMQLGDEIHDVAESLAGFRTDVAEKFGSVSTRLESFRAEFKEDLADLRADMTEKFGAANARLDAFRAELKQDLADFRTDMTEKFGAASTGQGMFRSEVETNLKFIRWIGVFFAGLLVSVFIGVITVSWNASGLYSNVQFQNRYLDEVKSEVREQGERLQKIEGRMERIEGRMDGIEGRMDRIEKQLEVLIRRGETKSGGEPGRRGQVSRTVRMRIG